MRILKPLTVLMLAFALAACAGGPNKKSTGEYVDDAVIATKVKTALARDDRVSAFDVEVEVFKGVVQLSGFVNSEAQIAAAEELAADVKGVIDVKNRLDIRGR
ncbi:MAG: BON domain-containing protein [Xanthomonadales bacterium]|nr:BON domain-containing protein [Xanthomonadales bacterium]